MVYVCMVCFGCFYLSSRTHNAIQSLKRKRNRIYLIFSRFLCCCCYFCSCSCFCFCFCFSGFVYSMNWYTIDRSVGIFDRFENLICGVPDMCIWLILWSLIIHSWKITMHNICALCHLYNTPYSTVFIHSFVHSFLRSFAPSFLRSFFWL